MNICNVILSSKCLGNAVHEHLKYGYQYISIIYFSYLSVFCLLRSCHYNIEMRLRICALEPRACIHTCNAMHVYIGWYRSSINTYYQDAVSGVLDCIRIVFIVHIKC